MDQPAPEPLKPADPPEQGSQTWGGRLVRTRHDLRNPLSEILGFSEILQEEATERGLQPMLPGFDAIHQTAARIFAEVNHWLSPDAIGQRPQNFQELERTIASLSERIISSAESLSEKCDELKNNWVGDDLLRIEGAARRLSETAPGMLRELASALAGPEEDKKARLTEAGAAQASTRARLIQESLAEPGVGLRLTVGGGRQRKQPGTAGAPAAASGLHGFPGGEWTAGSGKAARAAV